jgi:LysR family cyn operon transcriptional activator
MELRHLRYLVALAECLNFTRAAERVHVTQSTLSHQIRRLEDEVGFALFDRATNHVSLTEAGEVFLVFAANALREVDRGLSALKKNHLDVSGELRIGATNTFNLELIPQCVAAFLTRYPEARVTVEELPANSISAGINSGALDLGIAYRPTEPSDLWFDPLHNEEMVLAVSASHPFASRKRVRMIELDRQRLVLLPHAFATRVMLDDCFRSAGAEPIVCVEMNSIAPMLELVARTGIAAIVAANAVPSQAPLAIVRLASPTPMRIPGILWKRDAKLSKQMKHFSAVVRRLAQARHSQP